MRNNQACHLRSDHLGNRWGSLQPVSASGAGTKSPFRLDITMRICLLAFFASCFFGGAAFEAQRITLAEYKRVEAKLIQADIRGLTLRELSEIRI